MKALCARDYPGNVRELRHAVEQMVLGLQPSRPSIGGLEVDLTQPFHQQKERLVESFEAAYIGRLLEACGGNISELARRSGLNRTHLYRVLSRLKLSP